MSLLADMKLECPGMVPTSLRDCNLNQLLELFEPILFLVILACKWLRGVCVGVSVYVGEEEEEVLYQSTTKWLVWTWKAVVKDQF